MLILFINFMTQSSGKLVVPPPSLTDPSHTFVSRLRSVLYRIQRTTNERPARWKYELRPAVKKLYQLRLKVSASRVSVASRVVNPKNDELRPAVSNVW